MKLKYNLIFFLFFGMMAPSCKNGLMEDARSQVTDNYINTPAGFDAAVKACYSYLRSFYGSQIGSVFTVYGTDTYTSASGADMDYNNYNSNLGASKGFISTLWGNLYVAINACNAVIERAPAITGINEDLKNTRVAEVRFLRAQYYFLLVQLFGPVHLSLTETQGVVTKASRAPIASVYDAIIEDLELGIAKLKLTASDYGRVTKPAAENLLSKVYLTRAGSTAKKADDYENAAILAKNVIDNYSFKLLDDFDAVFAQGAGEKNSEVIFSVQYSSNVLTNGDGNQTHLFFLMAYDVIPGMQRDLQNGRSFPYYRPTPFTLGPLFNKELDDRFDKSFKRVFYCNKPGTYLLNGHNVQMKLADTAIYFPTENMSDAEIAKKDYSVFPPNKVNDRNYPSLTKFLDPMRPDIGTTSGSRDFIIYRLADTYLMAAEALMMSGKADLAVEYINKVRRRAAKKGESEAETLVNKKAMEVSAAALDIDFILDERARELIGEYTRWFDLVRTGKLVERVKKHNSLAAPNIKDYHVLRPIPQTQIDRTEGGRDAFPQNDGYQ